MLQSLRFRLPALFLAGVLLAGIVSAAIAFRLLQSYSEDQSLKELRRDLESLQAGIVSQHGLVPARRLCRSPPPALELKGDQADHGNWN